MPVDELYVKYRVFREPDHLTLKHDKLDPVPMHASFLTEENKEFEVWDEAEEIDGLFFVLRPETDHHARVALAAYIQSCYEEFPKLSADLDGMLQGANWIVDTGGDDHPKEPGNEEEVELQNPKIRIVK